MEKETTKEKFEFAKDRFKLFWKYGKDAGASKTLEKYDVYRKWSFLIWLIMIPVLLFFEEYVAAFFAFCTLHLHVLINQIWWKVKRIEYYEGQEGSGTDQVGELGHRESD